MLDGCPCGNVVSSPGFAQYQLEPSEQTNLDKTALSIFTVMFGADQSKLPYQQWLGFDATYDSVTCGKIMQNNAPDPKIVTNLGKTFCGSGNKLSGTMSKKFTDKKDTGVCGGTIGFKFSPNQGSCQKSCKDTLTDMINKCKLPFSFELGEC